MVRSVLRAVKSLAVSPAAGFTRGPLARPLAKRPRPAGPPRWAASPVRWAAGPVRWAATVGGRFSSRLHDERVAARLGLWLGVSFTCAFVTGMISHFMQQPPGWLLWPSRPVNLYRFTQGVHVIGGLATIPLLAAKLWTVYPRLWQWPPITSARHGLGRGLVLLLVGGALFQLVTGLFNIAYWYPFPFFFTAAHYWTAFVVYGALIIHAAREWDKVRRPRPGVRPEPGSAPGPVPGREPAPAPEPEPEPNPRAKPPPDPRPGSEHGAAKSGMSRRGFFGAVAGASGLVTITTVGETFSPLAPAAVFAPRRPGIGPQGVPVNRTARAAGVTVAERDWRLLVTGAVDRELSLSLADLRAAFPQRVARLPIACVEGWSAEGTWAGVRLRDVLDRAGVAGDARIRVESLQRGGRYRSSRVDPPHWHDPLTLLALDLGGEPLAPDHGFPCRLIAPNRPGVMQTKWISGLIVDHGG